MKSIDYNKIQAFFKVQGNIENDNQQMDAKILQQVKTEHEDVAAQDLIKQIQNLGNINSQAIQNSHAIIQNQQLQIRSQQQEYIMQKDSYYQQQQLQDLPYKVELQDAKPFVTIAYYKFSELQKLSQMAIFNGKLQLLHSYHFQLLQNQINYDYHNNNVFVGKSSIFGQPQTEQEIEDERCELELNKRRESLLASLEQLEEDVQLVVMIQKISILLKSIYNKSKQKSLYLQTRSQRGSKFRGVSKNGKKWQVMIVKGIAKKYLGAISKYIY